MKLKIVVAVLAAFFHLGTCLAHGHFRVFRCADDALGNDMDKINGRVEWGMRCSPRVRELIDDWRNYYAFNSDVYNPVVATDADGTEVRKYKTAEEIVFSVIFEGHVHTGYPSFGYLDQVVEAEGTTQLRAWRAPTTKVAPCDIPPNVGYRHMCPSGCYTGDQLIWMEAGLESVSSLHQSASRQLMTLDEESTLDHLQFSPRELLAVVSDPVPVKQTAYVLTLASGGELKVTPNHPLVDSNGLMRRADKLKVGDRLVRADGLFDPIVAIQKRELMMRAYNVVAGTAKKVEKIVVAQGYLSGDLYYQNAGEDFINRMILRRENWLDGALK